jgi:hypothetical protein
MQRALQSILLVFVVGPMLAYGGDQKDVREPDVRRLTSREAKDGEKRIRVDISFSGRANYSDNDYIGFGNLELIELRCAIQPDVRAEYVVLWLSFANDAKGLVRMWKNGNKTEEIIPHVEGSPLPYDEFGVDDLPEVIWLESLGAGTASISLRGEERPGESFGGE